MRPLRVGFALVLVAGGLVFAVSGSAAPRHAANAAFEPLRASFVSSTTGFVLGSEGCSLALANNRAARPCSPVLRATSDGGAHWRRVPGPPTRLSPNQSPLQSVGAHQTATPFVGAIAFADARNGWLYDPGLWATHDGGAHWTRIDVGQSVFALTVAGGWAYATLTAASPGLVRQPLLRSPVGSDHWLPVRSVTARVNGGPMPSTSFGAAVWVALPLGGSGFASTLWRSADGTRWQSVGEPCGRRNSLLSIAAASATDLIMECAVGATLLTSADGGAHVQRLPALSGKHAIGPSIAVPPGEPGVIAVAGPSTFVGIYAPSAGVLAPSSVIARSTDGGRSVTPTVYHDHGAGFIDLRFVSATVGWVVHGYPGAKVDQLMRTSNAGATFTPISF